MELCTTWKSNGIQSRGGHHERHVGRASPKVAHHRCASHDDELHAFADQLGHQLWDSLGSASRIAVFDPDSLAWVPAEISKAALEGTVDRGGYRRPTGEDTYRWNGGPGRGLGARRYPNTSAREKNCEHCSSLHPIASAACPAPRRTRVDLA